MSIRVIPEISLCALSWSLVAEFFELQLGLMVVAQAIGSRPVPNVAFGGYILA